MSNQDDIAFVPVDAIREHSEALRAVDRTNVAFLELANSVASKGILNPILVRKLSDPDTGEDFYGLVDGLQRLTAARDAGFESVPALIKDQSDMDVLTNQVVTNAIRVETKPVEYTRQIQRLMQMDPLLTMQTLAGMLGRQDTWIKQRLGLLNLTPQAADLVDEGLINVTNAYALSKLPADEQEAFLDRARELPHGEFVPLTVQRKKDLDKARREGKTPEDEVFKPTAKAVKLVVVQAALENPAEISALLEAEGCQTALEGAFSALKWAIGMDSVSVAKQEEEHKAREEAKNVKRKEAEVERLKRQEAVSDFKTRRLKFQLECQSNGIAGADLDAKLEEFDKVNKPATKKAEAEAAAE